jgi:predicted Zn finger-like uncharacterized protein
MSLTILCPDCQRSLRVPANLLGQAVKCPSCSHTFIAPESAEETRARPAEPPKLHYDEEPLPSKRPASDDERKEDFEKEPRLPREKPGKVQAIAVMILVGGILACIWGMGSTLLSGFACCLWPGAYYGFVMGIMAIVKGSNLIGDYAYRLPPPQGIAIMMIINIINGDAVNLTLGILVLVFLSDPEVKAYFRR